MRFLLSSLALLLIFGCAQTPPHGAAESLGGTSWQLLKFQGGDGTVLRPDDKTKYTFAFCADGSLNARIDCNRGRGTWKSSGKNQLELGSMALTPRLFLSMMADGCIYELEPL